MHFRKLSMQKLYKQAKYLKKYEITSLMTTTVMHFSFLNSNPVISWRYTGSARHIGDKAHTKQKMKHWWYSQIWSRYSYDSDSHTGDALVICRTIATQIVSYRNQTDSSCYWLMRSNYKWVTWRHQRKYIKSKRFKQVQDLPISSQCSLFIGPKNIIKLNVFIFFEGEGRGGGRGSVN